MVGMVPQRQKDPEPTGQMSKSSYQDPVHEGPFSAWSPGRNRLFRPGTRPKISKAVFFRPIAMIFQPGEAGHQAEIGLMKWKSLQIPNLV